MSQSISNLPIGALVKDTTSKYYGQPIVWVIADKNHSGYPPNSVTLLAKNILTLKCADAKEPSSTNTDRRNYGNNRYIVSNIRQWLNSAAAAGAWYAARHTYDAPPNYANVNFNRYADQAGFLNDFSTDFQNVLLTTTLTVGKASIDGGGTENFTDRVFLISVTELNLPGEFTEGSSLSLFPEGYSFSQRAYPTAEAVSNSEFFISLPEKLEWFLRTPYASNACSVCVLDPDEGIIGRTAFDGVAGIRPACNLPSSILVSDSPTDGAYIIEWWTPPDMSFDIGGVKKVYDNGWVKVDGTLKQIDKVWTKINGVLREV